MAQTVQLDTLVSNYHGSSGTLSKAEGAAAEKICPPQVRKRTHISAPERFLLMQLQGILHLSEIHLAEAPASLLSPRVPHLPGRSGSWPEHTSQQVMPARPGPARANSQGDALGILASSKHAQEQSLCGSSFPHAHQHFPICISAACSWEVDTVCRYYVCLSAYALTQSMSLNRKDEEVAFLERAQIFPPIYTQSII